MQRIRRTAGLALAVAIVLSGCTGSGAQKPETEEAKPLYDWGSVKGETITVWGEDGNFAMPYVSEVLERYQQLTGNTIEIVQYTKKGTEAKLATAYASASAERPDMLISFSEASIETLNLKENFYDFTDAPWIDDLTDMALNQAIFGGRVVGFPYNEAAISGTLYNKKLFKKYNLSVPKTQEEFLQVCETLLQHGVTPVYLPYAEISMLLYQFPMSTFLQNDKTLEGVNDGTLTYSQIPEMRVIVEWYKTMGDRGYFGADYTKNDWGGMDGAMKNEQYAMMLCWDTWLYDVFTGNPADFGLMPAFMGTPENGCFEGANMLLLMADKNGKNLDGALDLIKFFADPYSYNVAFKGRYSAPVYKKQTGSISTPQYMEAERLVEKYFVNSTARSHVKGFAQMDAKYIQNYMQGVCTLDECLRYMDAARMGRAGITGEGKR